MSLPAEIQMKIITDHMNLDELIAYAASNVISHGFFHENRAAIWKALYLRDINPTPLVNELGNGDDYRKLYLKWYNVPYREYVKAIKEFYERKRLPHFFYPDTDSMPGPPSIMNKSDHQKAGEMHWHIMNIYRGYRTRAGQRPEAQDDMLRDEDRESFRNTVRLILERHSFDERKALKSFRDSIIWKSYKLAKVLSIYWDYHESDYEPGEEGYRSVGPEVSVECNDNKTIYFGEFLSLLPQGPWGYFVQPALTPERIKLLSVEPTFYENFEGINFCVGDETGKYDLEGVFDMNSE